MVTQLFTCPNGHQWRGPDDGRRCPVCGAEAAETIGNCDAEVESNGTHPTGPDGTTSTTAELSKFGRYKIIEELGRGGMGIVYRALEPNHQREVALKTIPSADAALLSRFKREFRVLAGVDHPNVVKLFELNSDGETWFFTMEIIEGIDLLNYVGFGFSPPTAGMPDRTVDENDPALTIALSPSRLSLEREQRLVDGFAQLAGAVAALHAQGIVHRDVKPSNVIVTADGRVVLLDFGLVAETDPSGIYQSLHQQVMGTAAYMSPEQAACDPVSPASDWYSVGVMLYQSLTGRLPIAGKVVDILVNKQKQDPPPPREIEPSVSEEWNHLCMDLLCRDPAGRPAAQDILRRLGKQTHDVSPTKAIEPDEVALVGRETHLALLYEAWRAVRGGQAKCVFVEGRSGTGKSALVDAFVEQATRGGTVVLQGRCYEMESVPFKAIDSLIDSLVVHLGRLPQADAAALMPRDVHALARLFPVIGQLEAIASLPRRQIDISDQQELNRRAIGALRELLARMGDRYPLVVYIDDLQWGDEDSAAMLSNLLQPPDTPVLLFLGTYRSEDVDTSQFLQSFRQIQRQRELPLVSLQVEVTPLEHADAVELALALLRRRDTDAQRSAESIAREAAGNPFFVSELVKHLQLAGDRVADSTEPSALVDMIWSRVRRLPAESQRLLAVVALWGKPLPLDHAMQIAEVGQLAVGPLRSGHLIRTVAIETQSVIETYHDRIRESVSQRQDFATKQQLHIRIAEDFARQSPLNANEIMDRLDQYCEDKSAQVDDHIEVSPIWYEIAFHFDAAGRSDLAFPYALAAAEKARTQFSLEVAEQQYWIAERGVEGQVDGIWYRVAEGLGDVLMLRGRYQPAAQKFAAASLLAKDDFTRAQIEGKLGILAFKGGDNKASCEALERSLRLLGRKIPSRIAGVMVFLVWEVLVQTLHTMLPKLFLARRSLQGAEEELLAIDLNVHLSRVYFFERGKVPCLWAHLCSVNLAERYPPTLELGYAWAAHAPVMSLIPWFRRGEVYAKKSLEIRKELGDVCGQGQSLHYLGVVLFAGARFDECISACREAVGLLVRTGDYWEVNIARFSIANSLYRKGDLALAVSEARRLYEAADAMGDDKASAFALDVWSRASGGQVPNEVTHREMQKERNDVWATALVLLAEAVRRVGQDELDEAVKILTQAHDVCRSGGINAWVGPILPWLATTYRLQCQKSDDLVPNRRRLLLDKARRAARQAVSVARTFQTDLPHALREAGLISAMQGSNRRARKYLDESLAVAERQGAKFEHAQTLMARGSVGMTFGWPEAADQVDEARQALIELGADFALQQCCIGAPPSASH
jgi:tetratricopeptide (TPR) repeat protein/tRNA A-37 threonylcarbamoyl transferase component Bud32